MLLYNNTFYEYEFNRNGEYNKDIIELMTDEFKKAFAECGYSEGIRKN